MKKSNRMIRAFSKPIDYLTLFAGNKEYRIDVKQLRVETDYPFSRIFGPATRGRFNGPSKKTYVYSIDVSRMPGEIASIITDDNKFRSSYKNFPSSPGHGMEKYAEPQAILVPAYATY